jgi:hypothetical protein
MRLTPCTVVRPKRRLQQHILSPRALAADWCETLVACALLRQWKPHLKLRMTRNRLHRNFAVMLREKATDDIESESRPFSYTFGGEERIEDSP